MPRTRTTRRAAPLLTAALGAALLAGPGTGVAAAAKHTPCPTAGKTIAKATGPNLRVWREGTTMKACTRKPGQRRYVRTLGPWSTATKVAVGEGTVAWTTTSQSDEHGLVDAITTKDVRTGATWLKTLRAAPATDAATPASDDRVLNLITDSRATSWVTSRGVIASAVRKVDTEATTLYGEGMPGAVPFHVDRIFALGVAGPENAEAVAKGLKIAYGGDGDECGGVTDYQVRIPAFGTRKESTFVYASEDWTNPASYCH
ncbi:hypothetical protein [Patulibacter minatonensis]|uniref:hypothetical protein n=1 Tax=Patulibacter minatonensis TaxID=298163 RepID=UPI000479E65E|nr:hypothetical protein [Patulibacter minatonensis]